MKNERTCIFFLLFFFFFFFFFFSVGLFVAELCPFFDVFFFFFFFYFAIISLWNLVNKISGEPLQPGSYLAHILCPRCR